MKAFNKINKLYVQVNTRHHAQACLLIDTVSMPISSTLNHVDEEEWYKQVAEAIENLTFVYYEKEKNTSMSNY